MLSENDFRSDIKLGSSKEQHPLIPTTTCEFLFLHGDRSTLTPLASSLPGRPCSTPTESADSTPKSSRRSSWTRLIIPQRHSESLCFFFAEIQFPQGFTLLQRQGGSRSNSKSTCRVRKSHGLSLIYRRDHGHQVPIIGFSATFARTDFKHLSWTFEKIVYHLGLEELLSKQL
jgi:hypothetical protein